jgi:hypothetical protein
MLLQLDTMGSNIAKFYDNTAKDFLKYILGFGYVYGFGKGSDVKAIAPKWQVNAVNLSAGYWYARKRNEQLNLEHLKQAIIKVNKILSNSIPTFSYQSE